MEESTKENLYGALEAVLFASGEPISVERLAQACEAEPSAVSDALQGLAAAYRERGSAISIQQLGDSWQMCTHAAYAQVIQRAMEMKKMTPLSAAAMEVLTVVAYNQPVSKSFVEHVRGVDSSSVVNTLVEKELLMEDGRLDVPGHPIAYVTTPHFLRCFGLTSLEDLPPIPALNSESPGELPQEKTQEPADEEAP